MTANSPTSTALLKFGFGRLFDLVSDAVIVASATTGRIVLWNPGAAAMFGVDDSGAEEMPLVALVPEPLRDRHLEGLARYARGEPSKIVDTRQSVELPALRSDGTSFWIELQLSSVPTPDDAPADERFVIAIVRDVTARKAAEAEALASSDQLRAVNDGLRTFLAAVAHDIVGPAGGVKGAAELILQVNTPEQISELVDLVVRQADLVINLGKELGQLAVIEQGVVPVHPTLQPLRAAVDTAIEASGYLSDDGVTTDVPGDLTVYADASHVTRIVANLIGNAHKYGKPPVMIEAEEVGDYVELRVRDRGAGVPDDFAEKLFDKFTRAQTGGIGLGLGLAISKGLARANGGDVWYERSDGPGATFGVRFPARSVEAQRLDDL